MKSIILISTVLIALAACGSLEKKSILVNVGDGKELVVAQMGPPDDRQVKEENEALQYCQTGAGFGYHDYRVIWFRAGKVTGINSYKSTRAGSSCMADIRAVKWEEAPNAVVEIRNR